MRNVHLRQSRAVFFALIIVLGFSKPGWTGGNAPKQNKYPDPHALHLSVMGQKTADFSVDEIKDWAEFVRSLQAGLQSPAEKSLFGPEARMLISGIRPAMVTDDAKVSVVNELNNLLIDKTVMPRVKNSLRFSRETVQIETQYKKTQGQDDLKWLNRSIISDMLPRIPRKQRKGTELKRLTCTTCHEMYKGSQAEISERDVMDCFSQAIDGKKTMGECIDMANALKRSKIQPYGPLKNFIQRSNPEGMNPYLIAVRPQSPYTFKPLLKRLVCVECHSNARKVNKITGSNGKTREIPIFYGAGSGKHTREWASEFLKQ